MKRCFFGLVLWRCAISTPEREPTQISGTSLKLVTTLESVIHVLLLLLLIFLNLKGVFLLWETKHFSVLVSQKSCFERASPMLYSNILCISWLLIDNGRGFLSVVSDVSNSGISHTKEVWESQRKSYNADFYELDPSVVSFAINFLLANIVSE